MIDDINRLEEEINQTNNYDDELEYYSKTYDILFNYYNIIDGMNPKEIEQINNKLKESDLISNIEQSNTLSSNANKFKFESNLSTALES